MTKDRPRYAGRVEYFAVREQIKALLEKGCSLAMAFREMSGAGKITMSYEQFTKYASGRVCNVQPIYNSQKATKKKSKTPVSDSSQQKRTSDIAISEQEKTNQVIMENVSPNIVKCVQKRFSGEIKDTEVL